MSSVTASQRSGPFRDDSAAWRERSARLYEELRRPACAMVRRAFHGAFGDDEVEDIYASAWVGTLRALERRQSELDDEAIRRYLFTAVAHHASKELRRRSRRPTSPLEHAGSVADSGRSPDETAAQREHSRITRDLLSSLPPRRRAVLLLRYGWGLEPAQVCALVKGLSPRAYRKEITRGVDELTEKLRLLDRGEWCAEREPILKAYAAGLADAEQQRQAQQHLSHCRPCTDFVGKLSGHLHDAGSSVALPGAVDAIDDGRLSLPERVGDLAHRVGELAERARDAVGGVIHRGDAATVAESATPTVLAGGSRGAGAAGAGVLAKLAGLGVAGKTAVACLSGGVAVTACVAAGVGPVGLPDGGDHDPGNPPRVEDPRPERAEMPPPPLLPSQVGKEEPPAPSSDPPEPSESPPSPPEEEPAPAPEPEPAPEPPPAPEPEPPPASPVDSEFGLAPPAAAAPAPEPATSSRSSSSSSSSSSSGSEPTAAQQQFGQP